MRHMSLVRLPAARLSLGGAYFRLWIDGQGLVSELPSCVIRERDSGKILSFGEEAVAMSGRVPDHLEFVRPFAKDTIYDRAILRSLVEHMVLSNSQSLSVLEKVFDFLRYSVALPPTVSDLHQQWLRRTLREAGLWRWQTYDPFLSVAQSVSQKSRSASVVGVLDLGFSAARVAIYVGDEQVISQRTEDISLSQFCQQVCAEEYVRYQRQFSPAVLYDQQWFVQHVGFDEDKQKAVTAPIHKDSFSAVQTVFQQKLQEFLEKTMSLLASDIQASMQYHGWIVIGGGATIPGVLDVFGKETEIPIKMYKHTRYADIRLGE